VIFIPTIIVGTTTTTVTTDMKKAAINIKASARVCFGSSLL